MRGDDVGEDDVLVLDDLDGPALRFVACGGGVSEIVRHPGGRIRPDQRIWRDVAEADTSCEETPMHLSVVEACRFRRREKQASEPSVATPTGLSRRRGEADVPLLMVRTREKKNAARAK